MLHLDKVSKAQQNDRYELQKNERLDSRSGKRKKMKEAGTKKDKDRNKISSPKSPTKNVV